MLSKVDSRWHSGFNFIKAIDIREWTIQRETLATLGTQDNVYEYL
jgi:hypothetical protein